jgi:hypothetical protein
MRVPALALAVFTLSLCLFIALPSEAQQTESTSQNTSTPNDSVEGVIVSATRNTLVVRSDDSQFHLFTYDRPGTRPASLAVNTRVRVTAGDPDENGTRVATNVTVLSAASAASGTSSSVDKGAQATPVPEKVRNVESEIKRESRRWNLGVRAGAAFDPEIFMFGVHTQIGPIFTPRILFRPSAEFDFGEVTDLIALNFEPIYRFSTTYRRGNWTPYVGAGPSMIFIHQSFQQGRDISFGNFDYETGFNVLAGMQSRKGTFVEMKTSLWSGPAPKLRLIFGYNF